MIPGAVVDRRRIVFHRNRGGFLLGVTWVHYHDWSPRLTHFYLGWWTATLRTHLAHNDGSLGGSGRLSQGSPDPAQGQHSDGSSCDS